METSLYLTIFVLAPLWMNVTLMCFQSGSIKKIMLF